MNDTELLAALLEAARAAGADAADAMLVRSGSLGLQRRAGRTEEIERSDSRELGLRVFAGPRPAIVSATDLDPAGFPRLAERALAMARVVPEDRDAGLGPEPPPPRDGLDLVCAAEPTTEALAAWTAAAEDAARAVPGVAAVDAVSAGFSRASITLATSAGFAASYVRTAYSGAATAIAGEGTGMQRDYDYATTTHQADLDPPEAIGRRAGTRAVARLAPARPRTARLPVVYDPRVARSLLSHLAAAISGEAVAEGTSFLKDRLGQRIFAPGVLVIDDPHRPRGLRSRPFDGEGVAGARRELVADGRLLGWLLDWRSARRLGLASTGNAARRPGGPPGPSPANLWLAPGALSPAALMADIGEGLYVTELIGSGVNPITGDYSRGAAGFLIRNGDIAEPVAEITIAGNLLDMFAHLTPADDLAFRHGIDAPTLRIEGMTLAGA